MSIFPVSGQSDFTQLCNANDLVCPHRYGFLSWRILTAFPRVLGSDSRMAPHYTAPVNTSFSQLHTGKDPLPYRETELDLLTLYVGGQKLNEK